VVAVGVVPPLRNVAAAVTQSLIRPLPCRVSTSLRPRRPKAPTLAVRIARQVLPQPLTDSKCDWERFC